MGINEHAIARANEIQHDVELIAEYISAGDITSECRRFIDSYFTDSIHDRSDARLIVESGGQYAAVEWVPARGTVNVVVTSAEDNRCMTEFRQLSDKTSRTLYEHFFGDVS